MRSPEGFSNGVYSIISQCLPETHDILVCRVELYQLYSIPNAMTRCIRVANERVYDVVVMSLIVFRHKIYLYSFAFIY